MLKSSELELKLAEIKCSYIRELPQRATDLCAAWDQTETGDWMQDSLRELHRLVHSLSGSGATFGFNDLSAKAHALEVPLAKLLDDSAADRSALSGLFESLLAALKSAAEFKD